MSVSPIEFSALKERLETVEKELELMKSGVSFEFLQFCLLTNGFI